MSGTQVVCRCPRCGSLDAYVDEEQSMYELSFMTCPSCGHTQLADPYQRDEWLVVVPAGTGDDD